MQDEQPPALGLLHGDKFISFSQQRALGQALKKAVSAASEQADETGTGEIEEIDDDDN